MDSFELEQIVEPLLTWFGSHARILPWREEPTAYRVWVSEIMLQQTRVEAVRGYYARFLAAAPDAFALAALPEAVKGAVFTLQDAAETLRDFRDGLDFSDEVVR